jgi:energy-coupling factor transporter ATP-binding protein EcfA2
VILHRIEVEGFTRFTEARPVALEEGRVNLLCGANGSGKSTLLTALHFAFTVSHKSAGADVKAVQPWGRAVAPRVTVEFSHGGVRHRLTKVYLLKGRTALLETWNGTRYEATAQDELAERELPRFLGGRVGAGESARSRQTLLASILWSRQNEQALQPVESEVRELVRGIFGAQANTGLTALVEREARRDYEADWTPGGKLKKAAEAARLLEDLNAARKEAGEWKAELDALDLNRNTMVTLEAEAVGLRGQESVWQTKCEEWDELWKTRKEQLELRAALLLQIEAREQEAGRLRLQQQQLTAKREQAEGQRKRLAELTPLMEQAAAQQKQAEAQRREAAARAATEAGRLQAMLDAVNAPGAEKLGQLDRLDHKRTEIRIQLEGALLYLDLTAEAAKRIEVLSGESPGTLELAAGEEARLSGSPEIVVAIPGFGRLRASGPPESAAKLRQALARTEEQWQQEAHEFGGATMEALRQRRSEAEAIERLLEVSRRWLDQDEASLTAEARAAGEAAVRQNTLKGEQRRIEGELQAASQELSRLEEGCLGESDMRARIAALALEVLGLREKLNGVEGRLAEGAADAEEQRRQARAELESVSLRLRQVNEIISSQRGTLGEKLARAPYASYAEAAARVVEKEEAWREAQVRADGGRLLHETLSAVRREAESQIIPPLEAGANVILRGISEAIPGQVRLDEHLVPHAMHGDLLAEPVDLQWLSGGEFEQVHFAARLAMADLFTAGEPQPVVFDDALMATDAVRFQRILEMLETRRERMQILILTCHPERYAALTGAHVVQMGNAGSAGA